MKNLLITLSLFLTSFYLTAQAPSIEWQKSLGGTGEDNAYSIKQTADGGYVVAGHSNSINGDVTGNHGSIDFWVVKLTSTGVIDWQKSLGGTGWEYALSIQQTADGGYIVAGKSSSNNGDLTGNQGSYDYWVVKLTSTGTIDWQKSIGGVGDDGAYSVQQTVDGGYIVAGYTYSIYGDVTGYHGGGDSWVAKLDSIGIIEWQKSLGGTSAEKATFIQQTIDGGYIVAGYSNSNDGDVTNSNGGGDFWVVKLTSSGTIDWQKVLGGSGWDLAEHIQQTTDGGYVVTGFSHLMMGM